MTSQVENLRQTYDRTYDNLVTNLKIFFVIWPLAYIGEPASISTNHCEPPACIGDPACI